jgi:2-oxoglutarate ferredoxin oxidoreductase subunit delta
VLETAGSEEATHVSGSSGRYGLDGKGGVAVGAPVIDRERCKGCGLCVEFCPFGHLRVDEELNLAGYHPAEVEAAVQGVAPAVGNPENSEFFSHNFAYWCLRCRYCEIICPDAAVRVPGDVIGMEGVDGHAEGGDEQS